jgi:hypothetical protein
MSHPLVVHCKRESYDVYVGRPSKWGNPIPLLREEDRETVLEKYKQYLLNNDELLLSLHELKGKRLGCWCAPKKCHADVLAELAEKL